MNARIALNVDMTIALGKYYCRRSYSDISPEQGACDDFELDD